MPATKSKRKTTSKGASGQEDFLTAAAKTVGHAAGVAAMAVGLDHADSAPAETKIGRPKKRLSARGRRTIKAEEAKSAAEKILSKDSAKLGAPYRRVMGKPAANWSDKEIGYVNGLMAKQSA